MESFLELLKYTVPGLVVFATAYYLLKLYLDDRQRGHFAQQRSEAQKITLPLRLQAYERLTLLCDRVAIPSLLLRLRMPDMSVGELRNAMLHAVRQEFDHNTSQQLYVSGTLWQIITLAKEETQAAILRAAENLDAAAPDDAYVEAMLQMYGQGGAATPLQTAINAIRTEAERFF
jgi:hypothetical protein